MSTTARILIGVVIAGAALPLARLAAGRPQEVIEPDVGGEVPAECAAELTDQAGGECIKASRLPEPGMLLPLGPFFFVAPNGFTGIGTMEPSAGLHVKGTSGSFRLEGEGGDWLLDADNGTSLFRIFEGDSPRFAIRGANTGIGTTEPQAKLHVVGTAGVDGIMFPDGTLQTSAARGGGCCDDLSALYAHAFRAYVDVWQPDFEYEAFTCPPDRRRYITGIYVSLCCGRRGDTLHNLVVRINDEKVMGGMIYPWVGAGGAPLVVQPSETVTVENEAQSLYIQVTFTGYEF